MKLYQWDSIPPTPHNIYPLHTNLPYRDLAITALAWTWFMYTITGLGIALLFSSHAIDRYFWPGTTLVLGGLAACIGLPGAVSFLIVRKILTLLQKDICPLCQWGFAQFSRWHWQVWRGCQLLRIGSLLILLLSIITVELFVVWFHLYHEPLFHGTPLFYAGGLSLLSYVITTTLYLYIDTWLNLLAFEHGPLRLTHTHGDFITDWIIRRLNRNHS